jgi:trehalose/maltose hydrolase-like predicted phosphorylase
VGSRELTEWELRYRGWAPAEEPLREALCALGNGHFATRGAAEESSAGGPHYPGTYLAGGFDRRRSEISGKTIENEDLVNWPNWLSLTFRCEGGEWLDLARVEVLDYEQTLSLRDGVLARRVRLRDSEKRELLLETRRLVHMEDAHLAALEWVLTPVGWSGLLEIRSAIDGRVANRGVARYRDLDGDHLEILDAGKTGEDSVFLVARTRQSRNVMAQAVRTRIDVRGKAVDVERRTETSAGWVAQHLTVSCEAGAPVRVEKVLALYSSLDFAITEPCTDACEKIHRAPGFAELLGRHALAWERLWRRADVNLVEGDGYAQSVLRLHIFHVLQTASLNTIGRDVGVPARGLHGEAYRGHIFWDELFVFSFLNLRLPELTRSLLLYRYRRMDEARYAAAQQGFEGAMFPWQSGSNGREETQVLHLNPKSGRWIADDTHRQRHVSAAIAYNVWQYFQATGDVPFLSFYGAEMLLEIARFWASAATYSAHRERWEIRGIVGPDEFHTRYPGAAGAGLDNNAYTNVMAAWVLRTAAASLEVLPAPRRTELLELLGITEEDLARWKQMSQRMFVPFHGDRIISQFEGWDSLAELDWEGFRRNHGDLARLDRVLEALDDDVNRYKATKQADVLMLFFLFSAEELEELFQGLGYAFDKELIPRNVDYYVARTSHGSSLSRVVHSWVLARRDRKRSWQLFRNALASDIDDIQGGTTAEGIHMGAMGGTVDLMHRCYTGVEIRNEILWLNPRLPDGLTSLGLSVRYRGHWVRLRITHETMIVAFEVGGAPSARVGFKGEIYEMQQGQEISFNVRESAS